MNQLQPQLQKKTEAVKEPPKGPTKGLDKVFEDYKNYSLQEDADEANDAILRGPGILKYAEDMGINLESDPALIIIAWKLQINQEHVWEIGSAEFLGWEKLGCKSIDDMKKKVEQWKKELKTNKAEFKKFYLFVFDYLREDKKILAMEEAIVTWDMLDMATYWPLYPQWKEFIKDKPSVPRDLWRLLLNFCDTHPRSVDGYDPEACWPTQLDDFADHMKKKEKK